MPSLHRPNRLCQWLTLVLLCSVLGLCTPWAQAAERRMALVIGNADYAGQKPLRNPGNDAQDMAAALQKLGFKVSREANLGRTQMNNAIDRFLNAAEGAELAVVYYSGHGMQVANESFLIPVDARINSERDVRSEALRLGELMDDLEGKRIGRTVLIVDACRDNPFRSRTKGGARGLAAPKEMNSAFMVAYATADGRTADDGDGRNGAYTTELLKQLRLPKKSLRDVLEDTQLAVEAATRGEQRPKTYGDTAKFRDLYLLASVVPEPVNSPPQPSQAGRTSLDDLEREEATRKQWAQWQAQMKADYDKTAAFSGSADLQAKAWDRFLAAWAQDNPLSREDDELRAQATARRDRARQAAATPQAPTVTTAATGQVIKDCADCPELVVLPKGSFLMGSPTTERSRDNDEGPVHEVRIDYALAAGKYAVTFEEWDACMKEGGCTHRPADQGWGRGRRPVINVTWNDAQQYVKWLGNKTGNAYRLLSEAEWEYASRAGSKTAYPWGPEIGRNNANCGACGSQWDSKQTAPAGQFAANAFGLHDMNGNVYQWVQDVWHDNYGGAPADGSAWTTGGAQARRALRGGSWFVNPSLLRSAKRNADPPDNRDFLTGFRIARTL